MAQYYTKIQTLFKRDENGIIIPGDFTLDEFKYLQDVKWEATEKIDGTNMSVHVIPNTNTDECFVEYHGKTDRANIPQHLLKKMAELFPQDKVIDYFVRNSNDNAITDIIQIFGEGYGIKIRNGGNYIKDDCGFILFDVKIGDFWLNREQCEKIAIGLNIPIVPFIGYLTIPEAVAKAYEGFRSIIAENPEYNAEGLILKAPCGLLRRNGERLITKVKSRDFRQFISQYPSRKHELNF